MVNKQKFEKEALAKQTGKLYSIEYRDWMDATWYKGWFESLVPKWSEFKVFKSFDHLDDLTKCMEILENNKSYLVIKREYRIVKNTRD